MVSPACSDRCSTEGAIGRVNECAQSRFPTPVQSTFGSLACIQFDCDGEKISGGYQGGPQRHEHFARALTSSQSLVNQGATLKNRGYRQEPKDARFYGVHSRLLRRGA